MKNKRHIVIILTYAKAVFLCAKAQAGSTRIKTQIMLAGIYLGQAVMLHFAINWLWGDGTKATGNGDAGGRRQLRTPHLFRMIFKEMVGGEG